MPLLLLNQFLARSVGTRILPGKHSVAFILIQSGGVLILRTSVYIVVPSLTGIVSCAYLPLLPCKRYALSSPSFNRLRILHSTVPHFYKEKQIITEFTRQVQRHIHNPVKHLRWNFLRK